MLDASDKARIERDAIGTIRTIVSASTGKEVMAAGGLIKGVRAWIATMNKRMEGQTLRECGLILHWIDYVSYAIQFMGKDAEMKATHDARCKENYDA